MSAAATKPVTVDTTLPSKAKPKPVPVDTVVTPGHPATYPGKAHPPGSGIPGAAPGNRAPVVTPGRKTTGTPGAATGTFAGSTYAGKVTTGGTRDPYSGLPTDQRNALTALRAQLDQYGLGSLADAVVGYVKQGYETTSLAYLVSQTPEYKARFAANDVRIKNGLAPLAPAEYLALERSYRSVLQSANLPNGFYDSHDDFKNLIAADISPQELQERADHAYKYTQSTDPSVRNTLMSYYGIDDQHLAAYFLDPTKAQNLLNKRALAAEIGGQAARQGLTVDRQHAEDYADLGKTPDAYQTDIQNAGLVAQDAKNVAGFYGTSYSDTDATDEFVGGLASARRKREDLARQETASFAGDVQEARAFGRDNSGAY